MSRFAICATLFATSCLLVAQRAEPVHGQEKKPTVASLEKQVTALNQQLQTAAQQNATLQQSVAQLEKQIAALKQENNNLKAANGQLTAALKKANVAVPTADPTLKSLQATIDSYRGAGLVHVVILKLKSDSSAGETQSLIDDTYSQLSKIGTVRAVWAGTPTAKGTPNVVATNYDVALVFLFDDAAGLKTYLSDPVHTKFAAKHLKLWETPLVYDFEPKPLVPAPTTTPAPTIKSLQAIVDGYRGAGLVHVLALKLKADSSAGEVQSALDDIYGQLGKIGSVRGVWAGKPSAKGSPNAATTTDYTIEFVLLFDDAAGLKTYLNDPAHNKFADKHSNLWEKPVAYDFEPKMPSP